MSELNDLVRMANQIADFFQAYPRDEAVVGIAGHIRDFWTYRMREKLAAHIDAGGARLKPLVIEAFATLAAKAA
jgi:formate dehydrogenase subunit delta